MVLYLCCRKTTSQIDSQVDWGVFMLQRGRVFIGYPDAIIDPELFLLSSGESTSVSGIKAELQAFRRLESCASVVTVGDLLSYPKPPFAVDIHQLYHVALPDVLPLSQRTSCGLKECTWSSTHVFRTAAVTIVL